MEEKKLMNTTTLKDLINTGVGINLERYGNTVMSVSTSYEDCYMSFDDDDSRPTLGEIRAQLRAAGYQKLYATTDDELTIESWYIPGDPEEYSFL